MKRTHDDSDDLRLHIDAYAGFVMANLLWAALAITVILLPAATIGLFAVMSARVRGRRPETIWTFFAAVREKWRTATVVGAVAAAAGGFLALNLAILSQMRGIDPMFVLSSALTLFFAIVWLAANVYLWPLLALEDLPPRRLIEMSLRFALAYPAQTFGVLIAAGAVLAVSLLLPRGVFVLATASAVAYIAAWGSWRVIRRHLSEDELRRYTARD